MGKFIAEQTIKRMIQCGSQVRGAKVNILGLTFKENVPDLRNSRVIDVIHELQSYGVEVHVHDPVPVQEEAMHEYGIELTTWEDLPVADAMIVAVAHRQFLARPISEYAKKMTKKGTFIDVKSQFDRGALEAAGVCVWRL
jgi:UDP-N-acetyl-D-galactosamine dehydrogenase